MGIKDLGRKFFENKKETEVKEKRPEKLVQEEVINPIQNKDLTIQQQADKIINILKENPEYLSEIVEKVAESDEISQKVVDEATIKATDSPEVSDDVAKALAEQASDKPTLHVLKETTMPVSQRVKLNATIDDERTKEEADCTIFRKIYNNLKALEDIEALPEKLEIALREVQRTERTDNELYKLIAKGFAMMYHERNGAMEIYPIKKIIPLDEMMRGKIPQRIEEEYTDLLDDEEENKFNLEDVTNIFLERIAKESSEEANKLGSSIELFAPIDLGELSEKEIEKYLDYLNKYNPNLTAMARGNIKDRLQRKEHDEYSVEQFIEGIRELPEKQGKRYLSILAQLTPKEMDTVVQCIESGLIESLSKKKAKERTKYLETINKSVIKREKNKYNGEESKENKGKENDSRKESKESERVKEIQKKNEPKDKNTLEFSSDNTEKTKKILQVQEKSPTSPGEDDEWTL